MDVKDTETKVTLWCHNGYMLSFNKSESPFTVSTNDLDLARKVAKATGLKVTVTTTTDTTVEA